MSQPDANPSNTRLWDVLKRTDPKATKPFTRPGGFRGTQVDPTWRLQMLTEAFGPCGYGWGYELTAPVIAGDLVYIGARLWYVMPGEQPAATDPATKAPSNARWSGMQYGGDVMVKPRKEGGPVMNDEAVKMAVTDAIGKAALSLGLAADIYMGQFDDSKYREESEAFYAAKAKPELQPDAIKEFEAEIRAKLDAAPTVDAVTAIWKDGVNARVREIGAVDRSAQERVTALFAARKSAILNAEAAQKPASPSPAQPYKLDTGEGSFEEFPATKKGAGAFLDRLEDLVSGDRWYWSANGTTAYAIADKDPDTFKDQVDRIAASNLRMAG